MTDIDRRALNGGFAALALALVVRPAPVRAAGSARVVVVGGGPAGATAAVTLKRAAPGLDVTLIEPLRRYTTCFYSNHVIGGFLPPERIVHGYEGLVALGITLVHERAQSLDTASREVVTEGGIRLAYDRLVVTPGIGFKYGAIEGLTEAVSAQSVPHAWSGSAQTLALRQKIEAMEDGGLVVIAPPRNPYRCPPGPYERACLIANYLQRTKPKSKVLILDPKMAFSKQAVFEEAFDRYYKGMIELGLTNDLDDMSVVRVDPAAGEVETASGEVFKAAVANIIPDQKAGAVAHAFGLTEGDWCPVDFATFRSTKADDVYVAGDAAVAADMPKSAFSASNQAYAVAGHILADLTGMDRPAALYRNTCWSMLAPDDSVKIGADYAPGVIKGKPALVAQGAFISQTGESKAVRKETYEESLAWFETMVDRMFAKGASATAPPPPKRG